MPMPPAGPAAGPGDLRRSAPSDAAAVASLLTELCGGDAAEAVRAAAAATSPGPAGHEAWVAGGGTRGADPRGAILGFLALEPSSQPRFRVGSVEWIAVAPGARRQGLGLRLLRLAQERASALGWRQLHACTFHTNRPALHLYVEAGFYPAATLADYAAPGLHYVQLVWCPDPAREPNAPARTRRAGRRRPGTAAG